MKEHLVALCYILVLAGASFLVMAKPMTTRLMTATDFARRRNVWIAVTVITFLSHDFWLAMGASALVIAMSSRRERNPVALYCALLFVVPQFSLPIPGLGLVNQLFHINHPRMLALILLLPAAVKLASQTRPPNPRLLVPDLLFSAYFGYIFITTAATDSITGLMRYTVYVTLDHALLYYVVTRSVVDRQRFYDVLASFVMGVAVLGVIGAFEWMRSWLVYESLRAPLGVPFDSIGTYLLRVSEDGVHLRAFSTMGHAIAMGFSMMVALAMQLALVRRYVPWPLGIAVISMLMAGLLAALSRGPWLGCAIVVVLGLSFGPGARRRLIWMLTVLPPVALALVLLPQGQKFINLLPFVGTVEAGNVDYRAQLIDRAMVVFWQNPIFGSLQFLKNPVLEELRQGQGIIDIVNSYIGVALAYGGIGLLLFVALPLWALMATLAASHRLAKGDADSEAAGRALAMALLGSLLVIGTASQIFHIPLVHWLTASLCVAFTASAPSWRRAAAPMGRMNAGASGWQREPGRAAAHPMPLSRRRT